MLDPSTAPIAVFDSGVGGIGVLREVKKLLPHEDLLYFGDSAMAPYGEKPKEVIKALVLHHATNLLKTAKALVLACNTATAVAAKTLRAKYPTVPIIGMEPAIKPALAVSPHPRVLVLATEATLREEKLRALLHAHATQAVFYKCPAPGLVRLVEAGLGDSAETDRYLRDLLAPFSSTYRPDAVVLGCTHFPFAKAAILRFFGTDMPLFDGAAGTAKELARRLTTEGLLNEAKREGEVTLTSSTPDVLPLYRKLFYN